MTKIEKSAAFAALFFCLPSGAGKPGPARDVTPIRAKTIRIAPTVVALGEDVAGNARIKIM